MDKLNIFTDEPPEVLFDLFEINSSRRYDLILKDIFNYKVNSLGKNKASPNYLVFLGMSTKDEDDLGVIKNELVEFNFPTISFKKAIRNYRSEFSFNCLKDENKDYDANVIISRVTKQKIKIHKFKVKER